MHAHDLLHRGQERLFSTEVASWGARGSTEARPYEASRCTPPGGCPSGTKTIAEVRLEIDERRRRRRLTSTSTRAFTRFMVLFVGSRSTWSFERVTTSTRCPAWSSGRSRSGSSTDGAASRGRRRCIVARWQVMHSGTPAACRISPGCHPPGTIICPATFCAIPPTASVGATTLSRKGAVRDGRSDTPMTQSHEVERSREASRTAPQRTRAQRGSGPTSTRRSGVPAVDRRESRQTERSYRSRSHSVTVSRHAFSSHARDVA